MALMRTRAAILLTAAVPALWAVAGAPSLAAEPARVWADYRVGQYISSRLPMPKDILDLDNNGEILLACRQGCTPESLEASGVRALASQLELLVAWSLLTRADGQLSTAIPILDGAEADLLSERTGALAAALAEETAPQVAELVETLAADGLAGHAYALVFSRVLDGGVWDFLGELSLLPPRGRSSRGAPWSGEVWAYVSAGEREPRTSSLLRRAATVKISWVEELRPLVVPLLSGPLSLQTLFGEFLERGRSVDPELRSKLVEYGIVGPGNEMLIPVLGPERDDPVSLLCEGLVTRVAETVAAELDLEALAADLGLASEPQAMVIAYHELMWSLMDRYVESGAIELPRAIAEPASARPGDVGALVVMIRGADESSGEDEE